MGQAGQIEFTVLCAAGICRMLAWLSRCHYRMVLCSRTQTCKEFDVTLTLHTRHMQTVAIASCAEHQAVAYVSKLHMLGTS